MNTIATSSDSVKLDLNKVDNGREIVTYENTQIERLTLKGKAAVANAQLAYERYTEVFASDRWKALAAAGIAAISAGSASFAASTEIDAPVQRNRAQPATL